ncbi:MAG: ATP-binding protein, partial [bacterium]|nr:ATP-binding protein [bacterium]
EIEQTGDEIRFTIKDQGKGFDLESYMDFSPDRVFDNHGRGIAMANKFSFDRLEYEGCGNRVMAVVKCPSAIAE